MMMMMMMMIVHEAKRERNCDREVSPFFNTQ